MLACAPDAVLGDLFAAEGAEVLIGGAGLSADRIRDAVCATGAAHVIVLPNDAELARRTEQAAGQAVDAGHDVVVLPTASPVQGLAALAVHDPGKILLDLAVSLAIGGDCLADIAQLRAAPQVFGPVASDPTLWRALSDPNPRVRGATRLRG